MITYMRYDNYLQARPTKIRLVTLNSGCCIYMTKTLNVFFVREYVLRLVM